MTQTEVLGSRSQAKVSFSPEQGGGIRKRLGQVPPSFAAAGGGGGGGWAQADLQSSALKAEASNAGAVLASAKPPSAFWWEFISCHARPRVAATIQTKRSSDQKHNAQ